MSGCGTISCGGALFVGDSRRNAKVKGSRPGHPARRHRVLTLPRPEGSVSAQLPIGINHPILGEIQPARTTRIPVQTPIAIRNLDPVAAAPLSSGQEKLHRSLGVILPSALRSGVGHGWSSILHVNTAPSRPVQGKRVDDGLSLAGDVVAVVLIRVTSCQRESAQHHHHDWSPAERTRVVDRRGHHRSVRLILILSARLHTPVS